MKKEVNNLMSQVNVLIYGVILYCDDSILDIELGNGYVLEKNYLDDLPFKDKITDGEGKLTINYMGSQLSDEKGKYFICIRKEDTYSVEMTLPPSLGRAKRKVFSFFIVSLVFTDFFSNREPFRDSFIC